MKYNPTYILMSRPEKIDPTVIPHIQNWGKFRVTAKDAIIYALAIGFNMDPLNTKDFKYTFQMHKDFTVFPIQAAVFGMQEKMVMFTTLPKFPVFPRQASTLCEQFFHLVHDKILLDTDYHVQCQLLDFIDKGPGKGLIFVNRTSGYLINEKGEKDLAYYTDSCSFVKPLGGCGIKATGRYVPVQKPPTRQPDLIINDKTFPSQAFLYRLNSAPNPVHIDPELARSVGQPRPNLHGIATFAVIARSIVQNVLDYDDASLKSVDMRLTSPVYPGQSFEIKVWKENNKIYFEAEVVERKTKAINGVIGLKEKAKL